MITNNELYDMSFVISLIRGDIMNPKNILVLNSILSLLKDNERLIYDNQIRESLCMIDQLDKNWEFVKYRNYYVRTIVFRDSDFQNELLKYLSELKLLLQSNRFEQAYDLADALHVLPEIIANNNGNISKNYYKVFMKPYQGKWKVRYPKK